MGAERTAAQAWDSNNPQCVLLARWAPASPRKETRRVCVWVGLFQELFTFVILESETRTFSPRNVFNGSCHQMPWGDPKEEGLLAKICFFIFSPRLNIPLPLTVPPLCKGLSDMQCIHPWHSMVGRLGLGPHFSGEEVEVQRCPVTFGARFTERLSTSRPVGKSQAPKPGCLDRAPLRLSLPLRSRASP